MIDVIQPFWKPVGWTSFDVVKKLRSITRVKRVGHAGTLDPFAEGVLVLCFGQATKRVSRIMAWDKEYQATVKLGLTTDTLDPTGTVVEHRAVPSLSVSDIQTALAAFIGTIQQIPPMYSALKVGGKRLYQLARAGQTVPREPRPAVIYRIDLLDWAPPDQLAICVTCAKGTYIRTLAADLARALGTVGYLTTLIRTRVGEYGRSDAVRMEQVESWTPIAA